MVRFATLCGIALLAATPALAQGLPWDADTIKRGNDVRAGVQRRSDEGIRSERLRFATPEDARAWALEALAEQGEQVLIEVRSGRAVRLTGELGDAAKVQKALRQAWGDDQAASKAPDVMLVRAGTKVALLGKKLPDDAAQDLPAGLQADPEAARPLAACLEDRAIPLPPAPAPSHGLTGGLTPH